MNIRPRRLIGSAGLLVLLLVLGRWIVAALAERWWAVSISPAAADFVTRWHLLGLALDITAIALASGWFATQALLVARSIASVQVERDVGDLRVREAVPGRLVVLVAILTGVLLGVLTGAGARAWRVPIALASQGVHYGRTDPWLGEDLGVYVAQLPLWDLAHRFALTLAGLGVVLAAVLYVSVGGIRREHRTIFVHADARRHLGVLLATLAVAIGAGYLLAPYHLVSSGAESLTSVAVATRVMAMQAMAGGCLGVAAMCIAWAVRSRHSLVAAGWIVLAFGAVVERVVVPAMVAEAPPPPTRDMELRQLDSIAWGFRLDVDPPARDIAPQVTGAFDEVMLTRLAERHDGILLAATPFFGRMGEPARAGWLTATAFRTAGPRIDVRLVPEESVAAFDSTSARPTWPGTGEPRTRPDAPAWREVPTTEPSGFVHRIMLAWARQAPGMLGARNNRVDWHLSPSERAEALLPMATWSKPDLVQFQGRLVWVVQGQVPIESFPAAQRVPWRGRDVSGLVPAFVATVDLANGATRLFAEPAGDSLATAWARYAGALVEPATALPPALRDALSYPSAWFETQLTVLEGPRWGVGRRPGRRNPDDAPEAPVVVWAGGRPARQAVFEDPARRAISSIVTANRASGMPSLRIDRADDRTVINGRELERLWNRFLPLQHVRDSARAAGDTVVAGAVRWYRGPAGIAAWQPIVTLTRRPDPLTMWFAMALDSRLGGGRSAQEGWASVAPTGVPAPAVPVAGARELSDARVWMARADSALARGDLAEFARAINEVRNALGMPRR